MVHTQLNELPWMEPGCFPPPTGPRSRSLLHIFFWKLPNAVGIVTQGQDRDFPNDAFAQILEMGDLV